MNLSRIYFTSPISENSTVEEDSTLGLVDDQIARNAAKKALNPRRKKYNEYTASDRFRIGKYGMENGSRRTARAFQKEFPNLNDSLVCNFMKKYAKEQGHKEKMNGSSCVSIPNRIRGRPPMLGSIDQKVRDFLIALRHRGGVVNSTIAIAVGKAFISESCDKSVKNLCIVQSWAQSLFRRMGFVQRMSTIAKVPIPDKARKEIEFVFMHKIVKKIEKYNIPHDLVINADQTPLRYVPAGRSTLAVRRIQKMFPLLELQTSEQSRQLLHKP